VRDATDDAPPYIDAHEAASTASAEALYAAVWRVLQAGFSGPGPAAYGRIIGCEPRTAHATPEPVVGASTLVGFAVTEAQAPTRLVLSGRHRCSRYRLTFEVEARGSGSMVRATTRAAFPGLLGRLYRSAVIGTRLHRLVTGQLVRAMAASATRAESAVG
jgi:hypothetical protein